MARTARMAKDPGAPMATESEAAKARGYALTLSREAVEAWAALARCKVPEFLESFREALPLLAQVHAEEKRLALYATLGQEIDGKPVEREAVAGE